MKILFFTYPISVIGCVCLKKLLDEKKNVVGVVSPPELPAGLAYYRTLFNIFNKNGLKFFFRKTVEFFWGKLRVLWRPVMKFLKIRSDKYLSVKELVKDYPIPVYQPKSVKDAAFFEELKSFNPDLIVVATFKHILPKAVIDFPKNKIINVHPSFLPKYRGADPIFWVLKNKEKTTGVTIHYIDEGIDTGDIILQEKVDISPQETEFSLTAKLAKTGANLLIESVNRIERGTVKSFVQNNKEATYFEKRYSNLDG